VPLPRRRPPAQWTLALLPVAHRANHLDFGAGETETRLELPPGKHILQQVLGDAKHYPFNPPLVSKKITITVVK